MKKITAMLMLLVFSIGITCADGFSPTKENTVGKYFRLCTPNREYRYLTNNGAGNTMTGRVVAKFDNQVWRLLGRDDGTFDIQSVYDGSYMAMTSPITTSATKPADGWTDVRSKRYRRTLCHQERNQPAQPAECQQFQHTQLGKRNQYHRRRMQIPD